MTARINDRINWHKFGKQKWTNRAGVKIAYRDIDCGYLGNIVKFVRRAAARHAAESNAAWAYGGSGDAACMMAESAAEAHGDLAIQASRDAATLAAYLKWREDNNYILHAPR